MHTGHTLLVVILRVSMISCIYIRLPINLIYNYELNWGGEANKNKCYIHYLSKAFE